MRRRSTAESRNTDQDPEDGNFDVRRRSTAEASTFTSKRRSTAEGTEVPDELRPSTPKNLTPAAPGPWSLRRGSLGSRESSASGSTSSAGVVGNAEWSRAQKAASLSYDVNRSARKDYENLSAVKSEAEESVETHLAHS